MEEKIEIPGYSGQFITKEGIVYGRKGNILSQHKRNDGYMEVKLYSDEKDKECKVIRRNFLVHRLVALCFISDKILDKKLVVNHKDGNKSNNNLDNLEIVSYKENTIHAWDNDLTTKYERKVKQYTLENELIKEFASLKEAQEKTGFKLYNISKACRGVMKNNQHGGYIWKFSDGKDEEDIESIPEDYLSWKPIPNFPDYTISKDGKVYSRKRNKLVKPMQKNYLQIKLYNKSKSVLYVHKIVAEVYIPNPENKSLVNHKDGNKHNNHILNLEWVTYKENSQHACDTGLCPKPKGKAVIQLDPDTGEEIDRFDFLQEAGKKVGLKSGDTIKLVCEGKRKIAGGYRWKWVE
jgi:hypothetical protein